MEEETTPHEEIVSSPIDSIISIAQQVAAVAAERARRFAVEDTKTSVFVFLATLVLFAALIVQATSAVNPFKALDSRILLGLVALSVFLGHLFSSVLTKVWVFKTAILFSCLAEAFLLITHAIFGYLSMESVMTGLISASTVVSFSLLGGILSSDLQDSTWLGAALYMRHINGKLSSQGISYLLWDTNGIVSILPSDSVRIRWDGRSQSVICYSGKRQYPLKHCAPIISAGHQVRSAQVEVSRLFEALNPSWQRLLKPYSKALENAEIRTSWLVMLTVSVHRDPYSLASEQSKVSIGAQSLEIEGVSRSIAWGHPRLSWTESLNLIFLRTEAESVLHTALCSSLPDGQPHPFEELIQSDFKGDSTLNLRVGLDRTRLALLVVLFTNLHERRSVVSELARQTLRGFVQWYPRLKRDRVFLDCLRSMTAQHRKEHVVFSSCDVWAEHFSHIISNPTSLYLTMHDRLSNLSNAESTPFEQKALIRQMISQCTKQIMNSNRQSPNPVSKASNQKNSLIDGFQLEIGHKSQVVLSAIKLLFIHEFLVGDGE